MLKMIEALYYKVSVAVYVHSPQTSEILDHLITLGAADIHGLIPNYKWNVIDIAILQFAPLNNGVYQPF